MNAMDDSWKRAVRVAKARNNNFTECPRADKKFGKADRFTVDKPQGIDDKQNLLKQKEANAFTGAGRSMGNGRAAWEKVSTPGTESAMLGRTSPGVGPPLKGVGESLSAPKIGRAERFPRAADVTCSPGPGAYSSNQHSVNNAKPVLSDARTPGVSLFGTAPKKPRFRSHLAMNASPHGCWGYF